MMMKTMIAAAALAVGAPAIANDFPVSATVAYGDLNLGSASGVSNLERRIRYAAKQVCGDVPSRGLAEQARVAQCQDEVADSAKAQLEPVVAAAGSGIQLTRRAG